MVRSVPAAPKIYHIVHVDRLPSIVTAGRLWCDAEVSRRDVSGTGIAGSYCFEERCSLDALSDIDWTAVRARFWPQCRDAKQAEFLVERSFPWELVSRIGVCAPSIHSQAVSALHCCPTDFQMKAA